MLRRWIMAVIVCALMSVATTIIVSWACAYWIDPLIQNGTQIGPTGVSYGWMESPNATYAMWWINVYERDGGKLIESTWTDPEHVFPARTTALLGGLGNASPPELLVPPWATALKPPERATTTSDDHRRARYAFGWPKLAMWWGRDRDTENQQWLPTRYPRAIVLTPAQGTTQRSAHDRALPLGIIWPGFAINTSAAFGVLMLIASLYLLIRYNRRWRRRQRGACEKCGYPIGISPVCTECGADVTNITPRPS